MAKSRPETLTAPVPAADPPPGPYVIVRTYSAGVHAGYLERRDGKEVTLVESRRIWRWEGAATLSELAISGTAKPRECRVPAAVPRITLTEAIEVIECTPAGAAAIQEIPPWSAR